LNFCSELAVLALAWAFKSLGLQPFLIAQLLFLHGHGVLSRVATASNSLLFARLKLVSLPPGYYLPSLRNS